MSALSFADGQSAVTWQTRCIFLLSQYSIINNGSFKKVYRDLDHVEKCGFLHGVQHVSNNIFEVFLDIANFLPFFAAFHGNFRKKIF